MSRQGEVVCLAASVPRARRSRSRLNAESKLTGTVHFDVEAGRVRDSEVQVDFAGDLKWGDSDKPPVLKTSFQHVVELVLR
jgi:hypothetical protein